MRTGTRTVAETFRSDESHWVGDGFPVRTLFSYNEAAAAVSPFLLLDYAGPHRFAPAQAARGIGAHPHRGFETVTIVYDGEVEHRDSAGNGGVIGPGDVQWMTAGAGILHEERHSQGFTRAGGLFRMVQLWVNLPARDKPAAPGYQSLHAADIPVATLPGGVGTVRVIAGEHAGLKGPARTFTPINVWDVRLHAGVQTELPLPEGHTAMLVVLAGRLTLGGAQAGDAEALLLGRGGGSAAIRAAQHTTLLVLTGAPIDEPVVGKGPFVMNTAGELSQAFDDFRKGRFGGMAARPG